MSRADDPRAVLRAMFDAAVSAVQPGYSLMPTLPARTWTGRTAILSVGKASVGMAVAALERYGADAQALVIAPKGQDATPLIGRAGVQVMFGAHPVPDADSLAAGEAALAFADALGADDCLIALISGGGSAVMEAVHPPMTLEGLQDFSRRLLGSGLPIGLVNHARRGMSRIKGGGLARAALPARIVTRVLSDVPGDDPHDVASGPTLAPRPLPPEHHAWMRLQLVRAGFEMPSLASESAPMPRDINDVCVFASASTALAAAVAVGQANGLTFIDLGAALEGAAETLGQGHGELALGLKPRTALISGGETSVKVSPNASGRGGRNLTYLLSLAIALDGAQDIWALACDSDGLDGSSNAGGAIITPDTLQRANALGLCPQDMLERQDTHGFFEALGDLIETGPTGTNVNDLRFLVRV